MGNFLDKALSPIWFSLRKGFLLKKRSMSILTVYETGDKLLRREIFTNFDWSSEEHTDNQPDLKDIEANPGLISLRRPSRKFAHYVIAILRPADLAPGFFGTVMVRMPFLNFASTASSFESFGNEITR